MIDYRIEYIDGMKFEHPAILYKYRCWDNELHKKILTENKLYIASPKDFEDIYMIVTSLKSFQPRMNYMISF